MVQVVIIEAIVTEETARREVTEDIVKKGTIEVQAKREVTEAKVRNGVMQLKTKRGITEDIAEKVI
jgi:hypothetical protein